MYQWHTVVGLYKYVKILHREHPPTPNGGKQKKLFWEHSADLSCRNIASFSSAGWFFSTSQNPLQYCSRRMQKLVKKFIELTDLVRVAAVAAGIRGTRGKVAWSNMSNICTCCVLGSGEVVGKILSLSLPPRCGSARAVLSPESQFKIVGTQDDDCYRFFCLVTFWRVWLTVWRFSLRRQVWLGARASISLLPLL